VEFLGPGVVELAQGAGYRGRAGEPYVRAEVRVPLRAPLAPVAGLGRVHGNEGARRHAKLLSALVVHDGRELVAEHEGRLSNCIADLALLVVMEIRAAQGDSLHPQAQPAGGRVLFGPRAGSQSPRRIEQ
jgi:hypothetical protein